MDRIFTQEELYWLDDILPGTNVGRIRRFSAPRNVRIPKMSEDVNAQKKLVIHIRIDDRKSFSYANSYTDPT